MNPDFEVVVSSYLRWQIGKAIKIGGAVNDKSSRTTGQCGTILWTKERKTF